MVVIYNDSFLEKLRRLDGLVTISSYAFLEGEISKKLTPKEIINLESSSEYDDGANPSSRGKYRYLQGVDDLRAIWEKDTKKLKVCVNVPEVIVQDYGDSGVFSKKVYLVCTQAIQFKYINDSGNEEVAFTLVNDPVEDASGKLSIEHSIELSVDRNLITIQLPDYTRATLRARHSNTDDMFLGSYAADLGKNLFTVSDSGEIHITRDTFYKYFGIKIHKLDEEAVPFVINDVPTLDEYGNKTEQIYTSREYTSVNIFCSGVDNDCWVPTKFDLYRNYIDGEIRLYGTAKYREYKVIGNSKEFIGTGEETISTVTGIYFEEVEDRGLVYSINYDHQTLSYELPKKEDYNPNASVTLRAVVTKPDGTELRSNAIRFMLGGRDDEWNIHSKTTDYYEPENGVNVPVFLFPHDVTTKSNYKHQLVIWTSMYVEKKEDLELTLSKKLSDYFEVKTSINKEYDDLNNFKRTIITLSLKPKQVNNDLVKWNPLNDKKESELMAATIGYNYYSTSFYMVQSPRTPGLRLYEFNSLGSNFSAVKKIEFEATETSRIYWMLAEEKTEPSVRPWWTSYTSAKNAGRGISITGAELHQKYSYQKYESYKNNKVEAYEIDKVESKENGTVRYYLKTKKDGKVVKTELLVTERKNPGRGLFTVVPKRALRPDIEVTSGSSSGYYLKSDTEMMSGLKYLTVFDSFSIDSNGYITLNASKIVGSNGLTQADSNVGKNVVVGGVKTETDLVNPITRTLSTYVNNKNLGLEANTASYKSATVNNSSQYLVNKDGSLSKRETTVFTDKTGNNSSQNKILTTVATDGKLINNITNTTTSYYFTRAEVVGNYIQDRESTNSTGLTSAVNRSTTDKEQTTATDRIAENTSDSVLAFVREDGSIGYTSKSDGIAVKMVTDSEGKLVTDPRRIWDNRKLRPVIIRIAEGPKDVRDIEDTDNPFDPITFYRVSDELEAKSFEGDGKYPIDTWRNMVHRAQITYAVNKKGQEPFIQIIGSNTRDSGNDRKYKVYENGRFVVKFRRAPSTDIPVTYINRNSFIVRSNCPFKLAIKYNKNFEGTLEFDKTTREMKRYTVSNDAQSLYCPSPKFDYKYGCGVYINVLEADWTGTVGKITASYGELEVSSNVIAKKFTGHNTFYPSTSRGVKLSGTNHSLVMLRPRETKNLYFNSRKTLKAQFTSLVDIVGTDKEPVRVTTPDYLRVPIRYSSKRTPGLRVSKISPRFDEEGYVAHGTTLDMEVLKQPKYPLDPVGKLTVAPYKTGFNKGANYYIYNKGQEPLVKIDENNYIGVLGGQAVKDPSELSYADRKMLTREITHVTTDNLVYSLNKWEDMEQVGNRQIISNRTNGSNKVPEEIPELATQKAAAYAKMLPSAVKADYHISSNDIIPSFSTKVSSKLSSSAAFPVYMGYVQGSNINKSGYIKVSTATYDWGDDYDHETTNYYKLAYNPGNNSNNDTVLPINSYPSSSDVKIYGENEAKILGVYLIDYNGIIFFRQRNTSAPVVMWDPVGMYDHEVTRSLPIEKTNYKFRHKVELKPKSLGITPIVRYTTISPKQYLDYISAQNNSSVLIRHVDDSSSKPFKNDISPWLVNPKVPEKYLTKYDDTRYQIFQLNSNKSSWYRFPYSYQSNKIISQGSNNSIEYDKITPQTPISAHIYSTSGVTLNLDPKHIGYNFVLLPGDNRSVDMTLSIRCTGTDGSTTLDKTVTEALTLYEDDTNEKEGTVLKRSIASIAKDDSDVYEFSGSISYSVKLIPKSDRDYGDVEIFLDEYAVYEFKKITETNKLIYSPSTLSSSVSGGAVYQYKSGRWSPYYDMESSGTTVILDNVKWPQEILIKKHKKVDNKIVWDNINLKNNSNIYGFIDTTGYLSSNDIRFIKPITEQLGYNNLVSRYFIDYDGRDSSDPDKVVLVYSKTDGQTKFYRNMGSVDSSHKDIIRWDTFSGDSKISPVVNDNEWTYYEYKNSKWNKITGDRISIDPIDERQDPQYPEDPTKKIKNHHYYYNLTSSGIKPADPKVIVSIETNGYIKLVPVRWKNISNGDTLYTIPGAAIGSRADSTSDWISYIDGDVSNIAYTQNNIKGLDHELYTCIENPILWSAINTDEVTAIRDDKEVTYFTSNSSTPLNDNQTLLTLDDRELTGTSARVVDLRRTQSFKTSVKYGSDEILDASNKPIKANYNYKIPYAASRATRKIVKAYNTFIMLKGNTIPVSVIESEGKKYIKRTSRVASYYPRVYMEKIGGNITKKRVKPEEGDSMLNETTFTVLSRYRLQYPRIEEVGETFDITSTPTKLYYQYDSQDSTKQKEIFDAVNITSQSLDTISRMPDETAAQIDEKGKEYSKALDTDINVFPEKEEYDNFDKEGKNLKGQDLFRITYISESYDSKAGLYSYNITVIPKCPFDETKEYARDGRRDCGYIKITSRVREAFRDNAYIPEDILNYYPKILPLYNDGGKVIPSTGKTRPLLGLVYSGNVKEGGKDKIDYSYESTILPERQSKLNEVIQEDSITINVWQQKNNYLQMSGDRTSNVVGDTKRTYAAIYQPGTSFPLDQSATGIELSPKTILMKSYIDNWEFVSHTKQSILYNSYDDLIAHWPLQVGDIVSLLTGRTVTKYKLESSQRGSLRWRAVTSGVIVAAIVGRDMKDLDRLLSAPKVGDLVSIINSTSVGTYDTYEYTGTPTGMSVTTYNYDPVVGSTVSSDKLTYPYTVTEFDSIINNYNLEKPKLIAGGLDSSYRESEFSTKSVVYKMEVGNWQNVSNTWNWVADNDEAYTETIDYNIPGFETGLVCATSKNSPKIYLGDVSKKNTISEFVSGKDTSVDLFACLFDLSSVDYVNKHSDSDNCYVNTGTREVDGVTYLEFTNQLTTNKKILISEEVDLESASITNPIVPSKISIDEVYQDTVDVAIIHTQIYHESDGDHIYLYEYPLGNVGSSNYSVTKVDTITKDWSYEILEDQVRLDLENPEFVNNLRITFPPNESEDVIVRSFKIRATNPDNGVYHEVTLNLTQGSYLGTVNCDDTIRFYADGSYYSENRDKDGNIDPYFYFDTDIPSSELEFTIKGDDSALPYLGVGDDTNSEFGADFKKYRLNIKLSENSGKEKLTKTLIITRTYNLYEPSTGKLIPKKKEIKRVKMVQGYEAIYLYNPSYKQNDIRGKLDQDNPIPEFLTPGMIAGSFFNPLLVPKNASEITSSSSGGRKVMNYTFQIYYTSCVPDEYGDFTVINKTGDELSEAGIIPIVTGDWQVLDSAGDESESWDIDNIFVDGYKTECITDESHDVTVPCLYNSYTVKPVFRDIDVPVYVTMTVSALGKSYKFYAYMKKVSYDIVYPKN